MAPALVAFEAANIIRRQELAGLVGSDQSAQAHRVLLDLPIQLWPYEIVAGPADRRLVSGATGRGTSCR